MFMILPPTSAVGVTLLLCILPEAEPGFNWDHLGGPPPESNEPIAYKTISTLVPTPKWAKRIKEFLKRNRPRHAVEMLFPENATELAEQHKEIKRNMTKDPSWAWRKFSELVKLKGTTINQIPEGFENFTFPDMGINETYDCSKTDEKFNEYVDKVHLETDYGKLKKMYDPYDIENNKTIDWGHPTYDDEEFDQFVQKRIGRLLLSLYDCLTTGGDEETVRELLNQIEAITKDIVRVLINDQRVGYDRNHVFKHYFLDNVLVESVKLEKLKQISINFSNLVNILVQQFRHLDLNEIETFFNRLFNKNANIFQIFSTIFNANNSRSRISEDIVQDLFNRLLNKQQPFVEQLENNNEIKLDNLDIIIKPFIETHYDHSFDTINANIDNYINKSVENKSTKFSIKKLEESSLSENKPKLVNQINNVVNIYINKPRSQRKKRRSIVMDTTTYLPPWDPRKEMFPTLNVPGMSSEESFVPVNSFFAKKHVAYDLHYKRKLGIPNNNSQESFIFETFEYENPNKTRKAFVAQQTNIEKMKEKHEKLRYETRHNQSYQNAFMEKKKQAQQQKQQQQLKQSMKVQQHTKHQEKQQQHVKFSDDLVTKRSINKQNCDKDKATTTSQGISLQDITNVNRWFEAAQQYYTRQYLEEQAKFKSVATTKSNKPADKSSFDESYERYKRRKERRRKHKELSRRRYDSSFDESRSRKSSCEHCRRHRRRKHRKYHRSSRDSDYSESESSKRDRRRRRKYKVSSESSESRRYRNRSSESLDKYSASELKERRNKHKRSYDETSTTTTTTRTTTKSSTKRRSTRVEEALEYAEDEPSEPISDVPSHELTSWHYWKEWSLFYFMHPNLSISDMNITTDNIWKTTWPWTTKKVRVTKWRHPNVSWPPMSDDDSRSSQDSYDWGSGQSWAQNQDREMKSVEHFVRDNFFSEINEAASRLDKMNISMSGNSEDEDLDLSANEDRMVDFSARYRKDFREYKAKLKEQEREHQRWSLSGGNYSTTTEFDWEIKITKNYSQRSFRKGGHDIVFDISGMTLDPLSIEQIEKNLDADYLWKYGKNRTKTTSLPTTTSTTTVPTTTTNGYSVETSTSTTSASSTTSTLSGKINETGDEEGTLLEEGKSIVNSEFEKMTSQEREDYANDVEKNFDKYQQVDHQMFGKPLEAKVEGNEKDLFDTLQRNKRNVADNNAIKTKSFIDQVLNDRMNIEDYYLNNRKSKMHFLHELPKLSPSDIRKQELSLQSQLNDFLQEGAQRPAQYNSIKNNRRHVRRSRRGAAPAPENKPTEDEYIPLNEKNFNQKAHPEHPIFYLTEEDLKNGNYKNYNASFINDKLHENIDNMFEELKLNHDTSEEEKIANSVYHRKYIERRTTPFFNHLAQVIGGDNKRAIEQFTYPPDYDFDPASCRDPNKEPFLMELKKSYERRHAKSIEELNRDIELAKQGKLNTAAWRREAEEHVKHLPDDNN